MKHKPRLQFIVALAVLMSCVVGGCAGSPHGESTTGLGLGSTLSDGTLSGTGYYLIENAYEAEFVNCTGQAAILEGRSFAEGYALAPICLAAGSFDVIQNGNTLSMLAHQVDCSDGGTAEVSGTADIGTDALSGSWASSSAGGVSASQSFSGTMSTNSIRILEHQRSFTGTFDGECGLTPPLSASLTLI